MRPHSIIKQEKGRLLVDETVVRPRQREGRRRNNGKGHREARLARNPRSSVHCRRLCLRGRCRSDGGKWEKPLHCNRPFISSRILKRNRIGPYISTPLWAMGQSTSPSTTCRMGLLIALNNGSGLNSPISRHQKKNKRDKRDNEVVIVTSSIKTCKTYSRSHSNQLSIFFGTSL